MRIGKLVFVLAAALAAQVLNAQAVSSYATKTTDVKAGILLIESQRVGAPSQPWNPVPHVWFAINQNATGKPAGWTFSNPLGQSTLTSDMAARWAVNPASGGVPAAGTPLKKSDAPYWEVNLSSTNDAALGQFDILLLSVSGQLTLNPLERERLRKFVDQGGILWVDLVGGGSFGVEEINGLPYSFGVVNSTAAVDANLLHPLLSYPNPLTLDEILSTTSVNFVTQFATTPLGSPIERTLATVHADSTKLEAVAGNVDGRTIASGRLGDGYLVVTSTGISRTINRGRFPSAGTFTSYPNDGFRAMPPVDDAAFNTATKLVVNMISLVSAHSTSGAGSRKTSSTNVDVFAPVLQRFKTTAGAFSRNRPPALFHGYLVAVVGSEIMVYDANPSKDLDRDGNADDGLVDPVGATSDLIWRSGALGAELSAPTVVEVPETTLTNGLGDPAVDQIWVTGRDGNVYVFDLTVGTPLATIAPPTGAVAPDLDGPYAPTVHDGLVAITDSRATGLGRVWLINLNTASVLTSGGQPWAIQNSARLREVSNSATIGYIPIFDNSGGVDRVLYIPTKNETGVGAHAAGMTSVWLGAKGESPNSLQLVGDRVLLGTRASLQGLPILVAGSDSQIGVKLTLMRVNPVVAERASRPYIPFTMAEMTTSLTGVMTQTGTPGELSVQISAASLGAFDWDGKQTPGTPDDDVSWRVDYTLDWSRAVAGTTNADAFIRGNLEFPDDSSFNRAVIGSPALTKNGHVIVATSRKNAAAGSPGGTIFNLREEGRGDFVLVNRYDLTDALDIRLNGTTSGTVPYRETIVDQDELLNDIPFLNQPISDIHITTAPAVYGDTIYVLASGVKNIGFGSSPTSVLIALKAKPVPVEFEVANLTDSQAQSITLVQPDYAKSSNKNSPDQFSVLTRDRFTVEKIPNSNRSKIIVQSLMRVSRGAIRDSISTTLPVLIRGTATTDLVMEPEASTTNGQFLAGNAAGSFNPTKWYVVMNGMDGRVGPIVTGDTIYFGGSSVLPSLVASGFSGISFNGLMIGMDSQISANDTFLQSNTLRGWMNQLLSVRKNSPAPFDFAINGALRWPQIKGIQSGDDLRVRLLQAAIPETSVENMAAGDGSLAVTGPTGLYAFSRSDFFVVDSQRVSKFDPVGNPIWNISATAPAGKEQPVGTVEGTRPLANPTRIYPDGQNTVWIVDTGADRIIQTDNSGRELRSVSEYRVSPYFVPVGSSAATTTKLNSPRDILIYTTVKTPAQVAAIFNGESLADPAGRELWRHILVADSGNRRAVELVDRYRLDNRGRVLGAVRYNDPNSAVPVPALGLLFWHSPEELSGGQYAYNSIARTFADMGNGMRQVVAFGFGSVEPGRGTAGLDSPTVDTGARTGFGGVVIYDGPFSRVITSFAKPAIPANMFVGRTGANYTYNTPSIAQPASVAKFVSPNSVSLRMIQSSLGPRLGVMITDATGVYELVQSDLTTNIGRDTWQVDWMLPKDAYLGMRRPRGAPPVGGWTAGQMGNNPNGFRPMYAKRLDSGEVLIVSAFEGNYLDGRDFHGEVFLLEGAFGDTVIPGYSLALPNLGFNSLSVKFELPPVQGVREIIRPVYAERK